MREGATKQVVLAQRTLSRLIVQLTVQSRSVRAKGKKGASKQARFSVGSCSGCRALAAPDFGYVIGSLVRMLVAKVLTPSACLLCKSLKTSVSVNISHFVFKSSQSRHLRQEGFCSFRSPASAHGCNSSSNLFLTLLVERPQQGTELSQQERQVAWSRCEAPCSSRDVNSGP